MDAHQKNLLISLLLALFFLGVGVGWLFYSRNLLLKKTGGAGLLIALSITLIILGTPVAWQLSLLPSWNDLEYPILSGIGGGAYGLDYTLYNKTNLFYFIHWLTFALLTTFLLNLYSPITESNRKDILQSLKLLLRKNMFIEYGILGAIIFFVCFFFTALGWNRFWYSPMGRFEGATSPGGLSYLLAGIKFLPFLMLLLGVAAAFALALGTRPYITGIAICISVLPFIVMASRGLSIILLCGYVAVLFRQKKIGRIIGIIIAPFALGYFLLIPLRLRSLDFTGCAAYIEANLVLVNEVFGQKKFSFVVANVLSNLSLGFPIVAEVLSMGESKNILNGVPSQYLWLSFSPTISAIDGFSRNWVMFNPRINRYTPYNTLAELYGIGLFFSVIFMSLLYSLMLGLARSLARMGSLGYIASFVIAASVFLSLFQMQQYQIRTFMRVIYLAMVFYMAFAILYKTGFLNLLERSSQLYGKRKAYTMPLASTKQRKVTNASK